MAKKNIRPPKLYTHEGAPAKAINVELQLRRSVMACLLWESQFYESGVAIADRIANLVPQVDAKKVAEMAIEAREKMKLRHVPLLLVREMARHKKHKDLVAATLERVIQRADELSEFLAIYWKDKKQPISSQIKRGLAKAFTKFDAYQLAKYNRESIIKLRDVLFLCHAKPKDKAQAEVWKKLVDGTLESPDTWEVALSIGKDKRETWERLLKEGKLGAMALLRNLRNMQGASVDESLIFNALKNIKVERVLPFRFIAAARYAPQWEDNLEKAMMKCLGTVDALPGTTVLVIDVSGSMKSRISAKSEMIRMDAATGLAVLAKEICENVIIYSFSNNAVRIPVRHGFALRDAIVGSQDHSATFLGKAVNHINTTHKYDRIIVVTDEQAHDTVPSPETKGYMINVASYKHGVGYRDWVHIDGWSETVLDYIREYEKIKTK